MPSRVEMKDFAISNNVIDSIVTSAVEEIEGVAYVMGHNAASNILSLFINKTPDPTDFITSKADGEKVSVDVPVAVFFGYEFPELAEKIREAAAEALNTQIGVEVSEVNVRIDQLIFPKN